MFDMNVDATTQLAEARAWLSELTTSHTFQNAGVLRALMIAESRQSRFCWIKRPWRIFTGFKRRECT